MSVDLSPGIQEGRTLTHSLLGSDTCAGIFISFLSVERYLRQCTGKEKRFLTTHRFRHFSLWDCGDTTHYEKKRAEDHSLGEWGWGEPGMGRE